MDEARQAREASSWTVQAIDWSSGEPVNVGPPTVLARRVFVDDAAEAVALDAFDALVGSGCSVGKAYRLCLSTDPEAYPLEV